MNVEIEAEAAQLPEKEYKKGIFIAVYGVTSWTPTSVLINICCWELVKNLHCPFLHLVQESGASITFLHFPIIFQIGNNLRQLKGTG